MKIVLSVFVALSVCISSCAHTESGRNYNDDFSDVSKAFESNIDDATEIKHHVPDDSEPYKLAGNIQDTSKKGKASAQNLTQLSRDHEALKKKYATAQQEIADARSDGEKLIRVIIAGAFGIGLLGMAIGAFTRSWGIAGAGLATVIAASVSLWIFKWAWLISPIVTTIFVGVVGFYVWKNRNQFLQAADDANKLGKATGEVVYTTEMFKLLAEKLGGKALVEKVFKASTNLASAVQSQETQEIVKDIRTSQGFQSKLGEETKAIAEVDAAIEKARQEAEKLEQEADRLRKEEEKKQEAKRAEELARKEANEAAALEVEKERAAAALRDLLAPIPAKSDPPLSSGQISFPQTLPASGTIYFPDFQGGGNG